MVHPGHVSSTAVCVYLPYKYVMYVRVNMIIGFILGTFHTGFFQVGITALANLTARYAASSPPRTFFSLEKVSVGRFILL